MLTKFQYEKILHDLKDAALCLKLIKDDTQDLVKKLDTLAEHLEEFREKFE